MINVAVTNWEQYNAGELIFEWVTLPNDNLEEVFKRIGGDTYFISDYECEIPHIRICENENIEDLNAIAQELEDLEDFDLQILKALCEVYNPAIDEILDIFKNEDYTFYDVESFDELIDEFIEEGMFGDIPSNMIGYLDYEKIARDLGYDGYVLTNVGIISIH